jgi:hypothetical protein
MIAELQQPQRAQARLDELCIRYWAPVHAYFARQGCDASAAAKLTRGFFEHLGRNGIARASRHGRFRLFVLAELEQYHTRARASDTGLAIGDAAELALRHDFAIEVIAHSMERLHAEADAAGRLPMFERLSRHLAVPATDGEYASDALELGVHILAVAMAVRQLRRRFRELVDDELAQLTRSSDEFVAERQALFDALERTD